MCNDNNKTYLGRERDSDPNFCFIAILLFIPGEIQTYM